MNATIHRIVLFTVFFFLTTMFLGLYSCSGSGPVDDGIIAPENYLRKAHADWVDNGRGPLGYYHVIVPPGGGTPRIISERSADFHVDITGYVEAPLCEGCLVLSDFIPIHGGLSSVITLSNPFPPEYSFTAYDLRAVVLTPWDLEFHAGRTSDALMNPDGYTDVYTSEKYHTEICPYINFGTESDGFTLKMGATDTRVLKLYSDNMHTVEFDLIIDVSWIPPSKIEEGAPISSAHCREAYSIETSIVGNYSPGNYGVLIQGEISDWQGDAYTAEIQIDAPTLLYDPLKFQLDLDPKSGVNPIFVKFIPAELPKKVADNPILITVIDPFERKDGSHAMAHTLEWFIAG